MRCVIALALLLSCIGLTFGQCRNGSCAVPSVQITTAPAERYWKIWPENPSQAFLHEGGRVVGGYDLGSGFFRPWDGSAWGPEGACNVPVPAAAFSVSQQEDDLPTGMDWDKLAGKESYSINGKKVTERELRDRLCPQSFQQLPDDSAKRHLTFIAKDAVTLKAIKAALEASKFAPLTKAFRTQWYDASDKVESEMLSPFRLSDDANFQKTGRMVCVQLPAADGKAPVFSCVYNWQAPEELDDFFRKADPNYDPSKNPTPKTPDKPGPADDKKKTPSDGSSASSAWVWYLVAGGAVALFLLNRRMPQ